MPKAAAIILLPLFVSVNPARAASRAVSMDLASPSSLRLGAPTSVETLGAAALPQALPASLATQLQVSGLALTAPVSAAPTAAQLPAATALPASAAAQQAEPAAAPSAAGQLSAAERASAPAAGPSDPQAIGAGRRSFDGASPSEPASADAPTPETATDFAAPPRLPSWPQPAARQVIHAGESYPAVAMRPDTPIEPMISRLIRSARRSVRLSAYEFDLDSALDSLRWLKANRPEVRIEIILDQSHVYTKGKDHTGKPRMPSPQIQALIKEGFAPLVLKGSRNGIMHSKYLLIDAPDAGVVARAFQGAARLLGGAATMVGQALGLPALDAVGRRLSAPSDAEEPQGFVLRGSYNFAKTAEHNHFENVVLSGEPERVRDFLNDFKYKQALAKTVDPQELEKVLKRTDDSAGGGELDPQVAGVEAFAGTLVEAALPRPPSNPETPFELNGEKFQRTYFSPRGGISDAWLRAIGAAKESIEIGMFGFYSREVAEALLAALKRARAANPDFKLRMVLDAGQSSLAKFDGIPVNSWLRARGVDVKIIAGPNPGGERFFEKLHSKYMIVDGKLVITGSFNASSTAENDSFENDNVLMDPLDVAMFVWDFERLYLNGWLPRHQLASSELAK